MTSAHGAGGKASGQLISQIFIDAFGQPDPDELRDSAVLAWGVGGLGSLAFTTDSYVVTPIRFPGGSIGDLAVNGTVNDLAVTGAQPRYLTAAFVLGEGLELEMLRGVVADMAQAAEKAGVRIVAGDTKVVPGLDGLHITTSGVGFVPGERRLGVRHVRPGDKLILSGPVAAHGMAVLLARGDLALFAEIESDSAPVNGLVEALYSAASPDEIHWMRDATRGGLATIANELATASGLGVLLDDGSIPVADEVRGACDMLGIDPLYVANEGCFLAVVAPDAASAALEALHGAGAEQAAVIGELAEEPRGLVAVRNAFGGTRLVDMLVGDPLPRIC
ncbi:MAG: hydrogenase expression/formation protein HypE [Propionibacteriaceae bacterium]|nr:hydrogenase expression/formation protein HypE [Propionibacteriaceae bacterium]